MKNTSGFEGSLDQGRAMQFEAMMQQLAAMQSRYKGVRGELLARVRDELMRLKPSAASMSSVNPTPPRPARATPSAVQNALPSCRVCGRGMRRNGKDDTLICDKGHVRLLT